eukprot:9498960-Pyramimonas_sp.AAC.2
MNRKQSTPQPAYHMLTLSLPHHDEKELNITRPLIPSLPCHAITEQANIFCIGPSRTYTQSQSNAYHNMS